MGTKTKTKTKMKTVRRKVLYRLDSEYNCISVTPCPFWRMEAQIVSDSPVYVGTTDCDHCRWFCSKDVAAKAIECSIPQYVVNRYERELRQQNKMRRAALAAAADPDSDKPKGKKKLKFIGFGVRVVRGRGSIYDETYNKGGGRVGHRHVAEITIGGCRYRFRSASYERCWAWINAVCDVYRRVRSYGEWTNRTDLSAKTVSRLASLGILPKSASAAHSDIGKERAQANYRRALNIYNNKITQ